MKNFPKKYCLLTVLLFLGIIIGEEAVAENEHCDSMEKIVEKLNCQTTPHGDKPFYKNLGVFNNFTSKKNLPKDYPDAAKPSDTMKPSDKMSPLLNKNTLPDSKENFE